MQSEFNSRFSEALAKLTQGDLGSAEQSFTQILDRFGLHSETLHHLGVIKLQRGLTQEAVALIEESLRVRPHQPEALSNLGLCYNLLGRHQDAVDSCRNSLSLDASNDGAWNNLGNAFRALGNFAEARRSYLNAHNLQPTDPHYLMNIGLAYLDQEDPLNARYTLEKAILINSEMVGARRLLTRCCLVLGDYREGLRQGRWLVEEGPSGAEDWLLLGLALEGLDQTTEAKVSFMSAAQKDPDNLEVWIALGNADQRLSNLAAAEESFKKAVELNPALSLAHFNLGNVLSQLGRLNEAVVSFRRATELRPGYAEAFCNLGNALLRLSEPMMALKSFDRAIQIDPLCAQFHFNRGNVLMRMGRAEEACESLCRATELQPGFHEALWNRGMAHLILGDYGQGWKYYESRFEARRVQPRVFPAPTWRGEEDLRGKTLLLHAEQGLGDAIQFCRFAESVKLKGARVLLEVPEQLVRIVASLAGPDEIFFRGQPLPHFDLHFPLMSVPLALNITLDSIPKRDGYLRSNDDTKLEWIGRLGHAVKPRVGLVWSGNAEFKGEKERRLPLEELVSQLPVGFEYVSLKKEIEEGDSQILDTFGIKHFGYILRDFAETAALVDLMDLVVSSDTSVAHLSGALGKPTWVLLPFAPDWRWLLDRKDSPWYRSIKLYRQSRDGAFGPLIKRVVHDLGVHLRDG